MKLNTKDNSQKITEGRTTDDSCLFCGTHFCPGGGHYYTGKINENGNIETKNGGIIIEHLTGCMVQICPECVKKIRNAGIKL